MAWHFPFIFILWLICRWNMVVFHSYVTRCVFLDLTSTSWTPGTPQKTKQSLSAISWSVATCLGKWIFRLIHAAETSRDTRRLLWKLGIYSWISQGFLMWSPKSLMDETFDGFITDFSGFLRDFSPTYGWKNVGHPGGILGSIFLMEPPAPFWTQPRDGPTFLIKGTRFWQRFLVQKVYWNQYPWRIHVWYIC